MCCFSQPVVSVSDTNLFARRSGDNTQFLVYQMKFESKVNNAMILPLPVSTPAKEDSVNFVSLKEYETFFENMDSGFPTIAPPTNSRGMVDSALGADDAKALVVHEVGDFVASFVPTIDDFSRLDKQFVIPKDSWEKIPEYSDYGFAVFQLKELKGKPHPMAFEFETRLDEQIFFPTVHIHDGQVHKREEFDHTLYLQHENFDEVVGRYRNRTVKDRATGFVRSKWLAKEFCDIGKSEKMIEPDMLIHRIQMAGKLDNQDVVVDVAGNLRASSMSLPGIAGYWPVLPAVAGVAGVGWFFNRRNKVQADLAASKKDNWS